MGLEVKEITWRGLAPAVVAIVAAWFVYRLALHLSSLSVLGKRVVGSEKSKSKTGINNDTAVPSIPYPPELDALNEEELEEEFDAAATFVAFSGTGTPVAGSLTRNASYELQMRLYALYKQATAGPCESPAPSVVTVAARLKWDSWRKLGSMPCCQAMRCYVGTVGTLWPRWKTLSGSPRQPPPPARAASGGAGPRVSRPLAPAPSPKGAERPSLLASVRAGDVGATRALLAGGAALEQTDAEGRTALHWAADGGQLEIVQLLLQGGANPNAQDAEGETALHNAGTCEHEEIGKALLAAGALKDVKNSDGVAAIASLPSTWAWARST